MKEAGGDGGGGRGMRGGVLKNNRDKEKMKRLESEVNMSSIKVGKQRGVENQCRRKEWCGQKNIEVKPREKV